MAIAEMSKLNLVAMSYDRDRILNALQRTNATEVKLQYEAENTVALSADNEQLKAYLGRIESALDSLCAETDAYNKDRKIKSDVLKDGFEVSYSEFMGAKEKREFAFLQIQRTTRLRFGNLLSMTNTNLLKKPC